MSIEGSASQPARKIPRTKLIRLPLSAGLSKLAGRDLIVENNVQQ